MRSHFHRLPLAILILPVLVPLVAGCASSTTASALPSSPAPTTPSVSTPTLASTTTPVPPPPPTETYPPPPTEPTEPTRTPRPPSTRLPTSTPIQPTPFAPAEALPADFPIVVYVVQRVGQPLQPGLPGLPEQPAQLWRLRHERGVLQEELWVDLAPVALEGKIDSAYASYVGYNWATKLSASPDGRYVALILRAWEGGGAVTLIVGPDGRMYMPYIAPTGLRVGRLAWIPSSDRIVAGDPDGIGWGMMNLDGSEFVELPVHMLDIVVSPKDGTIIFSADPEVSLGAIDMESLNLTSFSLPNPLPGLRVQNLVLSPDGCLCAFTWGQVSAWGDGQIWLMATDGSNQRPLGPEDTHDFDLAWGSSSRTIAFVRGENPDAYALAYEPAAWVSSLWLIDVESGREQQILSSEGRYAHWSPQWLPDGSGLVFLSDRGGEANLWLIRPDGTGLQQLTYQGGLAGEIAIVP